MPDNFVLVPMQVDVMVLNQDAQESTPFNRSPTEYNQLRSFGDPDPPFPSGSTTQPTAGIYLHWTLPSAIRHGSYKEDGKTDFPFAPNRWLVVRVWAGASAADAVKAWILLSDSLADPATPQANFINPSALDSNGLPVLQELGLAQSFDSSLTSLPSQPNPFLQAIGPGTLTFANFSPNVLNVFAFTDVMQDSNNQPISTGTFSYYVAGWYSDADIDPLNNTTWQPDSEISGVYSNDKLDWYLFATSNALPTSTLVHGMVSNVVWDLTADNPLPQNYPTDIQNSVKVAIGNTAVDALSALIQLYTPEQSEAVAQADVLEAFQYGLLNKFDQPGSSEALNMAIRRHWYGASSGGTLWQIVPAERTDNTALPAPPAATITSQQASLLATLNSQQAELDRQQRILESMQWNLHALWWKYNWLQNSPDVPPLPQPTDALNWLATQLALHIGIGTTCNNQNGTDPSQEVWYYCQVNAQNNAVNTATTAVSTTQTQLKALLAATQMLKTTSQPQYFFPNDPVVLVTGLGRATNFDPQGSLLCRLPSQTVNALTINGTTYTSDGSTGINIQSDIPSLADPNNLLPDGIQQLHVECFMLSPDLFAQDVPNGPTSTEVETAIEALPAASAQGNFPPVAFTTNADGKPTWEWQQPWVPLLLDWQVAIIEAPAYSGAGQPTFTFDQNNWTFNGTDFTWPNGATLTGVTETTQMQLSGRTFITPSLVYSLADQLEKYHALDPNVETLLEDIDQYLEGIQNQDILSQRLSGLMAQMVQRSPVQTVVPTGPVASLLTDDIQGIPMPYPDPANEPVGDYAPMGGTFFVIQHLTVTDTFGRTIDLIQANGNDAPANTLDTNLELYFYPITGWNMQSPTGLPPPAPQPSPQPATAAQRMVQLPPRMVQDSQLNFRLISNEGQNSDIYQVAGANPICGWIVPNHLDRSLALYAADGTAWGELYLSLVAPNQYLPVWQPDPTNPQAPQTVADIPNTYVQNMLQALCDRTDDGLGFYDFLQVIDATLWTINPQGKRKNQDMSVLIGRPLAIVRAQLTLKLRGIPYYSQDWWNIFENVDFSQPLPSATTAATFATVDGGVLIPSWPVRLGSAALRDDGLIGYYVDNAAGNSFEVFNTVNVLPDVQTGYLNQIGANNNYIELCFIHDNTGTPDPAQKQVCNITMLLDPFASVHAFTGLLPVTELQVPSDFVTSALQTMYYTFRAGPFLTSPDAVRIPRPKASQGTWSWFDNVLNSVVPLSQADQNVRISITPPLIKEGWLKFTPNPAQNGDED